VVRALAIDIGTTSIRTGIVDVHGAVTHVRQAPLTVTTPNPGEVELDGDEIARLARELATSTLEECGGADVVGITNQRATTIVFDPTTGVPVGPALGWQDLRTVIDCLILQGDGLRLAPNQSATKARWLVAQSGRESRELRFATIETWVAWHLSEGSVHATDRSNAAVNGLVALDVNHWDAQILSTLGLDVAMMPAIVDTMGPVGVASALPGAPRITALVGDQQASLFGQSCVTQGAKITFGTGAMLDMVRGSKGPSTMNRFPSGCFPVVTHSHDGVVTWGIEGIVLSAGACIEWLRDDLGLIDDAAHTESLAMSVTSADGVTFVPALSGLGTPQWDFGARGGFFGITRGSTKAHLVRAVLEGIAHRGADLVDAAERETGTRLEEIRVDGGMSANQFFVQCLADFTGLRVAVSPEREATTRGAGLMALVAIGALSLEDVEALWTPKDVYSPATTDEERQRERARWSAVVQQVEKTIPELSTVSF
jgi:glycerol kinase